MENPAKLRHSIISHSLTACIVLIIVLVCLLHQFYSGRLTVQVPTTGWLPF